ncbi:noelin-2-like [Amphiura filiformis]|uniref:noelin-2-like n=1 Tax=Amphiura filiformis TaxID=82378 RepID=UPI003B21FF37
MEQRLLSLFPLAGLVLIIVQCSCAGMITSPTPSTPEQCTCMFRTPPVVVCTQYDADYLATLSRVQDKIANVTSQITYYQDEWNNAEDLILSIERKMSRLTTVCLKAEGRMVDDVDDGDDRNFAEISKHLLTLERMISDVKYDESYGDIMLELDYKLSNLSKQLDQLATDAVNEQEDAWIEQNEELQAELEECQQQPSDTERVVTITQWPHKGSQDTCAKLSRILQPFTIRQASRSSVWFTDPVQDEGAIWLGPFITTVCTRSNSYDCRYGNYQKTVSTLHMYNTTSMFAKSADNYVTYYLPRRVQESSVVAYDGYLYYIQYNTRDVIKFDITANKTVTIKSLPTEIGFGTSYPYTSGLSSLDLEVDESSLWMIYSTASNQGMIVFSTLNTSTLDIENTWYGNFPKKYLGNCFVTCATLYCISSHDSHNTKVNYFYDTKTNEEGFLNVPFDNLYGNIQSLHFNPYDQKLHAMDQDHVVVYDVMFE